MGLKRRQKKKNQMFDPKSKVRLVKLDHNRKCFVVDEAPRYPMIATPRQLQKRFHYYSESESESEGLSSDDEFNAEYMVSSLTECKDLIRMSSSSSDPGFEGGGTAPANPKKMLGKTKNNPKPKNKKSKKIERDREPHKIKLKH